LPVIASFCIPVHLVGTWIEVLAILLPLWRAAAGLICTPIVTMVLLVFLLLLRQLLTLRLLRWLGLLLLLRQLLTLRRLVLLLLLR